jgi:hypothetical protein
MLYKQADMSAKQPTWHEYQEEAGAFFRELGLDAVVDAEVTGARGTHKIDVWVVFEVHGLKQRWLVECKAWKSNIPKEKVATLLSVCADVGSHQAFLLSEVGFQAGAVALAQNTNIVLTSLAELRGLAVSDLVRIGLDRLTERLYRLQAALNLSRAETEGPGISLIRFKPGLDMDQYWWWSANLEAVKAGIDAARRGAQNPVYAWKRDETRKYAAGPSDFIQHANETLDGVEHWAAQENARDVGDW